MNKHLERLYSVITLKQFRVITRKTNDLHEKVDDIYRNSKALLNAAKNNRAVDQIK